MTPPRLALAPAWPRTWALLLAVAAVGGSKIDEGPELAVEQVKEEAMLEVKFAKLNQTYGIEDPRTLETFFELFDLWIMLYRLNKADRALAEVVPACEWRMDEFTIKASQALAFTRWKQGRFREALERFHEMEGYMGKNAALCENIGHTYNALGDHGEAERYFQDALNLTRALPSSADTNEGGILLGLATTQDHRGKDLESLQNAKAAYDFYKTRDGVRGWDSSLTAKAAMQLAKMEMKRGDLEAGRRKTLEAVSIFEATAGDDSPLVATALDRLGTILWQQGSVGESRKAFLRAYQLEGIKDAFDLVTILQIHNRLVETHLKDTAGLDRTGFVSYFSVVANVTRRVRRELPQDGNAGAYYKAAGELYVLGGDCEVGRPLLTEAKGLFEGETSVDTRGLIQQCADLVSYCDGVYEAPGADASSGASGVAEQRGPGRTKRKRKSAG